ncbi:hypothetical protein COCON_G00196400 [Conger conger]|uniref:Uncharacterized protein n=1 Tax=Conger conger TaxID=82655 RepID=A0A9Q1D159_CONCO|nr:hypothetical protein COCON_G00196400 [Conger conger]
MSAPPPSPPPPEVSGPLFTTGDFRRSSRSDDGPSGFPRVCFWGLSGELCGTALLHRTPAMSLCVWPDAPVLCRLCQRVVPTAFSSAGWHPGTGPTALGVYQGRSCSSVQS